MKDRIFHDGELKNIKNKILVLVEKGQPLPLDLVEKYNQLIYCANLETK